MAAHALRQRIITAVVALAVLLPAFVLLPPDFGVMLIMLFVIAGAWEWAGFLGRPGRGARFLYTGFIAMLLIPGWLQAQWLPSAASVAMVSLLWWSAAFVCILRFPVRFAVPLTLLCGVLVLVPASMALQALLLVDGGRALALLALATIWAADIGAYFAGRRFGRVRLAPRVSPGKTWEGVMGGLAGAGLVAAGGAALLGHPPLAAIPLGMGVAAVSVVGDLTVSMFKRNAGLKDSGSLFPGHGGVLDRIDSVTAAAPLFLLLAGWLGWLGG